MTRVGHSKAGPVSLLELTAPVPAHREALHERLDVKAGLLRQPPQEAAREDRPTLVTPRHRRLEEQVPHLPVLHRRHVRGGLTRTVAQAPTTTGPWQLGCSCRAAPGPRLVLLLCAQRRVGRPQRVVVQEGHRVGLDAHLPRGAELAQERLHRQSMCLVAVVAEEVRELDHETVGRLRAQRAPLGVEVAPREMDAFDGLLQAGPRSGVAALGGAAERALRLARTSATARVGYPPLIFSNCSRDTSSSSPGKCGRVASHIGIRTAARTAAARNTYGSQSGTSKPWPGGAASPPSATPFLTRGR